MIFDETSIKVYLNEIKKRKVLKQDEEIDLFKRLKKGDETAREKIIEANLRFVIKIALQFANKGLPLSDLVQEGNIGLLEVIDKYDHKRGFRFSTYAAFWIKQAIQKALRKSSSMIRIPVRKSRMIGKLNDVIKNFSNSNGRRPTTNELSTITEVTEGKLEKILKMQESVLSLDAGCDDDSAFQLLDLVPSIMKSPLDVSIDKQMKSKVSKAMDYLTDREKKIINLRFGIDSGKPLSLRKASKIIGLSQEGVRRIEHKALKKLRRPIVTREVEGLL